MKRLVLRYLGLLALAGAIIGLDQWTKALLRSRLAMGQTWPEQGWLVGLFKLVHTQNSGAAFSMGTGFGPLFLVLAVVVSLGILFYYPRLPAGEPLLHLAVGLMLGGTVGNLIDRLTIGQVTDFIAIRWFAVVNVADISLTSGVIAMILWTIIEERRRKNLPVPPAE